MAKRWTVKEDLFLVAYYEAVGAFIGPHDLGRTEKATEARVKHLRETGAWDAYKTAKEMQHKAEALAGHPQCEDGDWQ